MWRTGKHKTEQNKTADIPSRLFKAAVHNKRAYGDQLIFVLNVTLASMHVKKIKSAEKNAWS